MTRKKLSRNAICPCGSGKKYKSCCWNKKFEWVEEDANIFKSIPIADELKELIDEHREAFVRRHGREPRPNEPILKDLPHPEHLEHMMVEDMKKAGINPAIIYAFTETGLLVTEENKDLLSDQDLDEWHQAIDEYEAKHSGKQQPPQYPVGTVAFYGPNDKLVTKLVAGVIMSDNAEPILKTWVGTKIKGNPKIERELKEFFDAHEVESVAVTDGNLGCPHEEGEDFPVGEDCPFCPFWQGKQGSNRIN